MDNNKAKFYAEKIMRTVLPFHPPIRVRQWVDERIPELKAELEKAYELLEDDPENARRMNKMYGCYGNTQKFAVVLRKAVAGQEINSGDQETIAEFTSEFLLATRLNNPAITEVIEGEEASEPKARRPLFEPIERLIIRQDSDQKLKDNLERFAQALDVELHLPGKSGVAIQKICSTR